MTFNINFLVHLNLIEVNVKTNENKCLIYM